MRQIKVRLPDQLLHELQTASDRAAVPLSTYIRVRLSQVNPGPPEVPLQTTAGPPGGTVKGPPEVPRPLGGVGGGVSISTERMLSSGRDVRPSSVREASVTELALIPKDLSARGIVAFEKVGERSRNGKRQQALLSTGAQLVWSYFVAAMGKDGRYLLSPKRQRKIEQRLAENDGDVSEIFYAIDGAKRDDFIMGRSDRCERKGGYQTVETILRDRGQIERFRDLIPESDRGGEHSALCEMAQDAGFA